MTLKELKKQGLSVKKAFEMAESIEHNISDFEYNKIKKEAEAERAKVSESFKIHMK